MKHIIQINKNDLRAILANHLTIKAEDIIDVIIVPDDVPTEQPVNKPWYPVVSGEWVEVDPTSMTIPSELDPDDEIDWLTKEVRDGGGDDYREEYRCASNLHWGMPTMM